MELWIVAMPLEAILLWYLAFLSVQFDNSSRVRRCNLCRSGITVVAGILFLMLSPKLNEPSEIAWTFLFLLVVIEPFIGLPLKRRLTKGFKKFYRWITGIPRDAFNRSYLRYKIAIPGILSIVFFALFFAEFSLASEATTLMTGGSGLLFNSIEWYSRLRKFTHLDLLELEFDVLLFSRSIPYLVAVIFYNALLALPIACLVHAYGWRASNSARRLRNHNARVRRAQSLCVKCGYSLQGTISKNCPECGFEVHRLCADS